jgi:hypothetical protein
MRETEREKKSLWGKLNAPNNFKWVVSVAFLVFSGSIGVTVDLAKPERKIGTGTETGIGIGLIPVVVNLGKKLWDKCAEFRKSAAAISPARAPAANAYAIESTPQSPDGGEEASFSANSALPPEAIANNFVSSQLTSPSDSRELAHTVSSPLQPESASANETANNTVASPLASPKHSPRLPGAVSPNQPSSPQHTALKGGWVAAALPELALSQDANTSKADIAPRDLLHTRTLSQNRASQFEQKGGRLFDV